MNVRGVTERLRPFQSKLAGKLPLCPWPVILSRLDPRTLGANPPTQDIQLQAEEGGLKKLRFGGKHEAWFPQEAEISPEMWSEYLAVFWPHRNNGHRYITRNTPIRSGDVCVDCGACEGFFAFQALEAGAAKVICVEPNPAMAECLKRTFEKEIAAGRIVIKEAALAAGNGTGSFTFDHLHPFGGKPSGTQLPQQTIVPMVTLESLVAELNIQTLNFIKMDIEGGEIQAVEGALPILRRDHPRLSITTYHRSFDYIALRALLLASGYRRIVPHGITDRGEGRTGFRPVMLHAW